VDRGQHSGAGDVETPRIERLVTTLPASRGLAAITGLWCLIALVFALVAPLAYSAVGHSFLSSISEAPKGTALSAPGASAVDRASGDVFVADPGRGMVDVFSSSGSPITQIGEGGLLAAGVGIDETTGRVYVADTFRDVVAEYRPSGSGGYELVTEWVGSKVPGGAFGEVAGVAVDNSHSASAGDVYVLDAEDSELGEGAVEVYKPQPPGPGERQEGTLVRSVTSGKMELPNGIAVSGTTGEVYVADSIKGLVYEFSPLGVLEHKLTGAGSPQGKFRGPEEEEEGNVTAVATDDTTGDLLVAEGERHVVSEFKSAGEWVGWITNTPSGPLLEPRGVAVAGSGAVYVSDPAAHVVDVYGPGAVVPDVKTGAAAKVTRTTAQLEGTINGDGKAASYHFEWGESVALGKDTPTQAAGTTAEKASAALTELHAGTTYFFRLVGENENGVNVGIVREFRAAPAVQALATGPVEALTAEGATLTGTLTPNGFDAHYYFEWGPTASYGNTSPAPPGADAGAGAAAVTAKTGLSGLTPNTSYHYRLVASNSFGTTQGEDATFTTSGPPRISSEATSGIGHETATVKAKVNPDELATSYHFEYGETTAYGAEVPIGGASIGSGSAPVPVSAALTGLKLGVTYHFRVVATNSAGTTDQPDQTFTTVPPALIDSESTISVGSTSAVLQTEVNPLGNDTKYYFQYGTKACRSEPSACTDIPSPPGADIGSGETDVFQSEHIEGLKPATTYHYRVLVSNTLGTSEDGEHTFTTQAAPTPFALADNRAWEMVSPPDKQGAPVEALTREGGVILSSLDGNSFTYLVNGALGEEPQGNRSPEWQQVLAHRTASGWRSQDIVTPAIRAKGSTAGATPEYQYFTPDLSEALVQPNQLGVNAEPPLAPGVTQATMYVRDNSRGTYLPLVDESDVAPGTMFGSLVKFVNGTPDLSHVVLSSQIALTGPSSAPGLYEWSAGALKLVSVLPNGTPVSGLVELGYANVQANAISADGSRIIWTTPESARAGHLYLRDTAHDETVRLDAAQGVSEPAGTGTAHFQTASSDGSKIFFTDAQRLTPESTAEALPPKPDLYECEMASIGGKVACKLTDLTAEHIAGEHANVQGLLFGTNEDGTSTYFVAQGVLATNQNGNGQQAVAGKTNLYELHNDGTAWTTTYIATLASEDGPEWEGFNLANTAFLTARVSPNGRYLAFMSAASLTGYDNVDASPEAKGARDEEVYLYDSATGGLRCVSCNATGARPVGVFDTEGVGEGLGRLVDRRKIWFGHWLAGSIPGWTAENLTSALIQSRYLSNEGRLFFNSPDTLVPQASNHKENVYEYEASGLGSCGSSSGGCVFLISSGESPRESAFIEATPDGSNVFFVTAAQLLPQDTDTAYDIYDARICTTTSSCLTPPVAAPPGCNRASACRPAPPAEYAPIQSSGTATFTGPGNAVVVKAPPSHLGNLGATVHKPTRAQLLAKALKACHKQHSNRKRAACERHARKLYGSQTKRKGKKAAAAPSRARTVSGRGRR
jgi:phosphodiesterase/alkaline phosphatase D-like protein